MVNRYESTHLCPHLCVRQDQVQEEIGRQSCEQDKGELAWGDLRAQTIVAGCLSFIWNREVSVPALYAQGHGITDLRIVFVVSSPNFTWLEPLWSCAHLGRGRAPVLHFC
jgi:hypothetical protein